MKHNPTKPSTFQNFLPFKDRQNRSCSGVMVVVVGMVTVGWGKWWENGIEG
jgi:hypothetical protein